MIGGVALGTILQSRYANYYFTPLISALNDFQSAPNITTFERFLIARLTDDASSVYRDLTASNLLMPITLQLGGAIGFVKISREILRATMFLGDVKDVVDNFAPVTNYRFDQSAVIKATLIGRTLDPAGLVYSILDFRLALARGDQFGALIALNAANQELRKYSEN